MSDLATFFREKKKQAAQEEAHRQAVLEEWLRDLQALRDQLLSWLEPAIQEGLTAEKYDHRVEEHFLGAYTAPALRLRFGKIEVHVIPKARYIVGGTGRVDIEFPGGGVLLVRKDPGGEWQIIRPHTGGQVVRRALKEETFVEVVQEAFSL